MNYVCHQLQGKEMGWGDKFPSSSEFGMLSISKIKGRASGSNMTFIKYGRYTPLDHLARGHTVFVINVDLRTCFKFSYSEKS